jgi:hypothetical protein
MRPPPQKNRPIGFYLTGGIGLPARINLPIRPEELTRTEPSRLQVNQTLGGAWADSFGAGLAKISLSGHCGWRGSFFIPGEDAFYALRETVFQAWHDRRSQAAQSGADPSAVRLYYADTLNDIRCEVAPLSFALRRSKASPLLYRYQISLVVLDEGIGGVAGILDSITRALSNPLRWIAGVTGLGNIIVTVDSLIRDGLTMLALARDAAVYVAGLGLSIIRDVQDVATEARGIFDSTNSLLLTTARRYATATRNAFHALAASPGLTSQDRATLMAVAAGFQDAACTMGTSFNVGRYFTSYEDLFGASGCSSTAGGRSWSTYAEERSNPFKQMFPPVASRLVVTPEAQDAMDALNRDPLVIAGNEARVAEYLQATAAGVRLAA